MRCRFCGSKAIYPYTQHEQGSAGRVVAGAIIAGTVGAVVGLAGKNVKGYRCSACGMFSEQGMAFSEELSINSAVRQAQTGDTLSYERYRNKYANLEFVSTQPKTQQSTFSVSEDLYGECVDNEMLPEAEPEDTSIKHIYSPNQFVVGSPIFISKVTIKDNDGTDVLLLDINNISGKTLRSVYLNITVYDDVGDQIVTSTFAFQGLSTATGEQLPQAKPFNLNTNVAYKVAVICEKAAFADDTVWRKEENPTIYPVQERVEMVTEGFAQYKYLQVLLAKKGALRVGQKLYYPAVEETHRLCVCGNPAVSGEKCMACGLTDADLQEVLDYDVLIQCRKDVIVKNAQQRTDALNELYQQAQEDKYQEALGLLRSGKLANCKAAAELFASIAGYKDAAELVDQCKTKAEELEKQAIYDKGKSLMLKHDVRKEDLEKAILEFRKIPGWKDADAQIKICQKKIEEIAAKEEADRIERERQGKLAQEEAVRIAKRNRMKTIIVITVACAIVAFIIVLNTIIIPNAKYNNAVQLVEEENYEQALQLFLEIEGFDDVDDQIKNIVIQCTQNQTSLTNILPMVPDQYFQNDNELSYVCATSLFAHENYDEAYKLFSYCKTYMHSEQYLYYLDGKTAFENKQWDKAISKFQKVHDFYDASEYLDKAYYERVITSSELLLVSAVNTLQQIKNKSDEVEKLLSMCVSLSKCASGYVYVSASDGQDYSKNNVQFKYYLRYGIPYVDPTFGWFQCLPCEVKSTSGEYQWYFKAANSNGIDTAEFWISETAVKVCALCYKSNPIIYYSK